MIQILKIPESILNESTAIFTTYIYIISNRYKKSKNIKITYEALAKQMNIHIRHIRTYIEELIKNGFITVSEPTTKQNGKKGAVTITLTTTDQHYVILPLTVMLDKTIPKTYRQYYARLKRIINLNTFTTFKTPTELQQHLGCNVKTYREFMKCMKSIKIDEHALILDETNGVPMGTVRCQWAVPMWCQWGRF